MINSKKNKKQKQKQKVHLQRDEDKYILPRSMITYARFYSVGNLFFFFFVSFYLCCFLTFDIYWTND
jgi:hypothetical protein